MSIFQERLSQIMKEKNIKAAEIARATNISAATISKYLSDENKKAAFDYVLKIAAYLDIDPNWLGGLSDERKPFKQPPLLEIYEQLSDIGKKQVLNYANFVLANEQEQNQNK